VAARWWRGVASSRVETTGTKRQSTMRCRISFINDEESEIESPLQFQKYNHLVSYYNVLKN
jgi:hypothetical protein